MRQQLPDMQVIADEKSIAVGRDFIVHVTHTTPEHQPCPHCKTRWINPRDKLCEPCERREKKMRLGRLSIQTLIGMMVSVTCGYVFGVLLDGQAAPIVVSFVTVLTFMLATAAWTYFMVWMECDAQRQLRALHRWVARKHVAD